MSERLKKKKKVSSIFQFVRRCEGVNLLSHFSSFERTNERTNERTKRSETISSSLRDGKMLFRKNFFVLGGREMVPKIKFIFYRCVGSRWLKYIFQCWAIFNNNNLLDWQKMLSIIAKN